MAVAFTYGLKEKAGGGGLEFDAAAVAAANGESPAKSASKPKKPKAAVKKDDYASNGSSASFTSGIPTPPDEVSLDGKTCPPPSFFHFFGVSCPGTTTLPGKASCKFSANQVVSDGGGALLLTVVFLSFAAGWKRLTDGGARRRHL
jgi:hypothetical protein